MNDPWAKPTPAPAQAELNARDRIESETLYFVKDGMAGLIGWCLIGVGVLLMIGGALGDAAPAGSRTVNYEMMLTKLMALIGGGACLVAGAVFAAAGMISSSLARAAARSVRHGSS